MDKGDPMGSDQPTGVDGLLPDATERVISDLPRVAASVNWEESGLAASAATVGLRGCEAALKQFDWFP